MSEKRNIPKLRFPDFTDNWINSKVGKLTEVSAGGTPSTTKPEYWNGDIRWMNSGELNLKKVYEVENRITSLGLKKSSTKIIPEKCILIGLAGQGKTRGTAAINYVPLCTNQSIAAIYPNPKTFVSEFLYFNIDNRYEELRKLSTGEGGRGGLNLQIIKAFPVTLPSLPEQQKIAEFLTAVDQRIELLQAKKEKLEAYKKGVMQKIFSQQLRFKAEDGSEFPDWEERKLGNLGQTFNGLTGKSKENFGQGKPYIQYKQIFDSSEIKPDGFGLVEVGDEESQSRVQRGDVFFTTSSETPHEIGMASVLITEVGDVYLNSFCFGYRPNSTDVLKPEFSRYFFRSPAVRKEIVKLAQGSTRYNMSKVELMKLSFKLPTTEEQKKIAQFLTSLDSSIDNLNQQINQTQIWKKGLLQKMFV